MDKIDQLRFVNAKQQANQVIEEETKDDVKTEKISEKQELKVKPKKIGQNV